MQRQLPLYPPCHGDKNISKDFPSSEWTLWSLNRRLHYAYCTEVSTIHFFCVIVIFIFCLFYNLWHGHYCFISRVKTLKINMWFLCRYMNLCVCDGGCLRCKGHRRKFCLEYQLVQIGIISFTRVNMLTVMRGANKALIDLTEAEVELDQHESHLWRLDRLISLWSLCAVILPHYTSYVHAHIVIIWLWGNPPPPLFFSFRRETRTTNPS